MFSVNESARGLSRLEVSSFEGCSFINGVPASLLPEQVILTNGTLVIVPVYTVTFIDGLTGERIMDQEVPEGSGAQAPNRPIMRVRVHGLAWRLFRGLPRHRDNSAL